MADQPPTLDERLTAMHVTLREMLLVVRAAADQHDDDFANASPARAEWNEVPDGMSGDRRQAYETGLVLWHAILDHGHGSADLIDTRRTYGAMTVSRALAAARSWQLLEEGLSPHDRVERMLNERLYASHENELLLRGLLPNGAQTPNVSSVAKAKAPVIHRRLDAERTNRQQLLDTARRHQIAPIRDRTGRPASVGRGRATSMDVLNRLLQQGRRQVPSS